MGNMNRNCFYVNWEQREVAAKGVISVPNFKVVTSFVSI